MTKNGSEIDSLINELHRKFSEISKEVNLMMVLSEEIQELVEDAVVAEQIQDVIIDRTFWSIDTIMMILKEYVDSYEFSGDKLRNFYKKKLSRELKRSTLELGYDLLNKENIDLSDVEVAKIVECYDKMIMSFERIL